MKDMVIRLLFQGDANRLNATLNQSENRLRYFGNRARHEFNAIARTAQSLQGKLATMGISIGAAMLIKQSAQLDKSLIQIGQTADMSRIGVIGLRKELFKMSKETGKSVEDMQMAFNKAVQAGLKLNAAIPVTEAVGKASAVTGARAETLTASLTSAAAIFNFDLKKPGQALLLLDKMRVAGKQGNAEMEDLANIFPRVGFGAKRAGMNFDQTLAFVEALSQAESNPERLATLSSSWLRLFTNNTYMKKAQQATGVGFFDAKGARREGLAVFTDIKKRYDTLKTDTQRHAYVSRFLDGADTETITASTAFLDGDFLANAKDFNKEINAAAGTIVRELPAAIENAVDQTARLKSALRETADDFTQRLNKGVTVGIKMLLDSKKEGGMGMSGKELIISGMASLGLGYLGYKKGGKVLKSVLGKLGNTGRGLAEGKAIEHLTGVTPVFVTNWPGNTLMNDTPISGPGGFADKAGKALKVLGPAGIAAAGTFWASVGAATLTTATAVLSAGDAMRGGSGKNWISEGWGQVRGGIYGDMLYDYVHPETQPEINNVTNLNITIAKSGRTVVENSDLNHVVNLGINRGAFF